MNDRNLQETAQAVQTPPPQEPDDEIDLAELVGVIREYLLVASPVYRAEALLQVKEATPSVGSVQDTIQNLLAPFTRMPFCCRRLSASSIARGVAAGAHHHE